MHCVYGPIAAGKVAGERQLLSIETLTAGRMGVAATVKVA
jgi:hypothetical protein